MSPFEANDFYFSWKLEDFVKPRQKPSTAFSLIQFHFFTAIFLEQNQIELKNKLVWIKKDQRIFSTLLAQITTKKENVILFFWITTLGESKYCERQIDWKFIHAFFKTFYLNNIKKAFIRVLQGLGYKIRDDAYISNSINEGYKLLQTPPRCSLKDSKSSQRLKILSKTCVKTHKIPKKNWKSLDKSPFQLLLPIFRRKKSLIIHVKVY